MPTVPPSANPMTSTIVSTVVHTTRLEWPRAAMPAEPVARAGAEASADVEAGRDAVAGHAADHHADGGSKNPSTTSITRPTTIAFARVLIAPARIFGPRSPGEPPPAHCDFGPASAAAAQRSSGAPLARRVGLRVSRPDASSRTAGFALLAQLADARRVGRTS